MLGGGDFSEILDHQERSTGARLSDAMEEFCDFINYFALMDLPLSGSKFSENAWEKKD